MRNIDDDMGTIDELSVELREKYPQLTIRRDGSYGGEVLLIYEGDKSIAGLHQASLNQDGTRGKVRLDLLNSKPEQFPTFARAKKRLKDWLAKQFPS